MKTFTEYLFFNTRKKREYVRITDKVEEIVRESRVRDGMVLVSAMHITAGVWVNDAEDGLLDDIDNWLESLTPYGQYPEFRWPEKDTEGQVNAVRHEYKHHLTGEDNGDSHLKSILVHHQVILPITDGRLDLGTWQQVYYAEFDGQRRKRVIVKVMGA
ncbi:MAG: secondary thiamine-phosphate synthase enzyme YjbQ [Planctomycetota bacterium]|jgi:secondary thiamine-phosphate synthase enzyme